MENAATSASVIAGLVQSSVSSPGASSDALPAAALLTTEVGASTNALHIATLPATLVGASTTALPAADLLAKVADILGKRLMEEVKVIVVDLPLAPPIFQHNIFGGVDVHEKYKPPFMLWSPNEHVARGGQEV
jgi:hypothetical protein